MAPEMNLPTLSLPLRSDPPWLQAGVLGVCAASVAAFSLVFSRTTMPAALGVLPGITAGVFLGSALGHWSRKRGATVHLEASRHRVDVRDPADRHPVLDLASPFSAVLLVDRTPGRRMLVVGQHGDPLVVLETSAVTPDAPPGRWSERTLTLDLEGLALSAASPNVVALASGHTLASLLAHLEPHLDEAMPWVSQPTASGASLLLTRTEVRFGSRAVPLDGTVKAVPYAVQAQGATVASLGLVQHDSATMLFACEDALVEKDAVTGNLVPDAYVPLAAFELLRAVVDNSRAG